MGENTLKRVNLLVIWTQKEKKQTKSRGGESKITKKKKLKERGRKREREGEKGTIKKFLIA
jgi:hypothetical protein